MSDDTKNKVPEKREKLNKPKEFTVVSPFLYGDKLQNTGSKISLDDVQTINNLTPKYIR